MFFLLTDYLVTLDSGFAVLRYVTLRAILGILTALVLSLMVGPLVIRRLGRYRIGQPVRADGPQSHLVKSGTPTMGGALILFALIGSTLLWADPTNRHIQAVLAVTFLFGLIGGVDDLLKLRHDNSYGLRARVKFAFQVAAAAVVVGCFYATSDVAAEQLLIVPFFKQWSWPLGLYFLPFSLLVIVGASNAVNLTDGLDGLAIMPVVLVGGALGVFAYASGHSEFSQYLGFPFLPGSSELVVFCACMVGAGLGFLWFNTYPAQVFMGDIGALSMGAALGMLAVLVRQELVLAIMGGVFVAEVISVFIQVISYRFTGQRVFRMAPLHHHFELQGQPEPRLTVRFWIVTVVLVLLGLATLKLR